MIFLFLIALVSWPAPMVAEDRVKLAPPDKLMGYLPVFIAMQRGFFRDEAIALGPITLLWPSRRLHSLKSRAASR
jgi:hypothetical protein